MACKKDCCMSLTEKEKRVLKITSLAFIDKSESKHYLFEASTDITEQLNFLDHLYQILLHQSALAKAFVF